MLTRIYGTAFFSDQELQEHLSRIEEAKKRDHRVLGKQLGLFLISEAVGPGLPLWMPKGTIIRRELEGWLRGELVQRGYQPVVTPHIGRLDLYRTSGHYPYYKDSQFPPMPAGSERGRLPAQADELPAPHPDLHGRASTATATCRCGWRSSARSTAWSSRAN